VVTGKSAKGVFNPLPALDHDVAEKLATRLSERTGGEITVADVVGATTIEQLADAVRQYLEGSELSGFVRTLRKAEGSEKAPLFLFHSAGSSTMAYEPLLKRLPDDQPVYGIERVDGDVEQRAEQYLPELRRLAGSHPFLLAGWSLGGILAVVCARRLREQGHEVAYVGLIDTVMSADPAEEDSLDNRKARIRRYQKFFGKTYNVDLSLDEEQLEELAAASDDEQIQIVMQLIEFAGVEIPPSMVEGQRQSWIDNRALAKAVTEADQFRYDGSAVLYLGDRYHDGVVELEPRFANRAPNGGWDGVIAELQVVYVGGDHVQIVDEPYISTIGADLTRRIAERCVLAE
jgi:polyketide synthase 13